MDASVTSMIQPLLPSDVSASPMLLKKEVSPGINLMIGATNRLSSARPGNGGFRIWKYGSVEAAAEEAVALAQGMEVKHMAYNTGCAGAKVVCDVGDASIADLDKEKLLDALNEMLHDLDGSMYTGCDMNSTLEDMEYLASKSPYILAAIGNDTVDPNAATAHGVVGALIAAVGSGADPKTDAEAVFRGRRALVHGCGAVGAVVAAELAAMGAEVFTLDIDAERAAVPGCKNISGTPEADAWWTMPLDVIVPCSKSGLITEEMVAAMRCSAIVGATNLPFASAKAQRLAEVDRRIKFVPEGISSAGAVIVDSVEQFDQPEFAAAKPEDLYEFCRHNVFNKTVEMENFDAPEATSTSKMPALLERTARRGDKPIGLKFKPWKNTRRGFATAAPARQRSYAKAPARGMATAAGGGSDVVICGGGIMGLNIAYQLKLRDPSVGVTVLERANALGHGSSGWSTGFMRAFYSFDEQMELALDGISAYKNWGEYTRLKETRAYFTETGALWMLGKTQCANEAMKERLMRFGVESEVLDAQGLKAMFPTMNTDAYPEYDMETGEETGRVFPELSALYEVGCGHLDSSSCLEDMLEACQREGVDYRFNASVADVIVEGGRAAGVRLEDGSEVRGGAVVNALGPWFRPLNDKAGASMSTQSLPTRIQVGHVNIDSEDLLSLPFTADCHGASGVYFMPRRANKQLVFGSIDHRFESEIVDDPDNLDTLLDAEVEADYISCLLHRLPTLPRNGKVTGFSHMYTVNQDDVHPVVGPSAEVPNFYMCIGHSGHGFKCAPAYGSLIARQILNTDAEEGSAAKRWETLVRKDFLAADRSPLVMEQKTHFA